MDINDFIKTVSNNNVKNLLIKKVKEGSNLVVNKNDLAFIRGRYVVGHGGYTVTELV